MTEKPPLPEHIAETVRLIADFHEDHRVRTSFLNRAADRSIAAIGRPTTIVAGLAFILIWMLGNTVFAWVDEKAFDPAPFPVLELIGTLVALFLTGLILVTQRRNDRLAEQRAELTLQLALASEKKTAKLIALIEELRHDLPLVHDRSDPVSAAMAKPADAQSVLDAIRSEGFFGRAGPDGDE